MAAADRDESTDCVENLVPPSSSNSLRLDITHTYRRRRLRNVQSPDDNRHFSHKGISISVKVERLFDCSLLDKHIKEGAYENMPVLFPSDIHQFWKRLESVGAEIISLARGVSNRSKACCIQFSSRGFNSHVNSSNPNASAEVGERSDGKEFLICHLCQEMYHFSCIDPARKWTLCQEF